MMMEIVLSAGAGTGSASDGVLGYLMYSSGFGCR